MKNVHRLWRISLGVFLVLGCWPRSSWAWVIPPDRATVWNPGLNAVGGIPAQKSMEVFKDIPAGASMRTIQQALDAAGKVKNGKIQVVRLAAGDYAMTGDGLSITRSRVVLRGAGPSLTRLVSGPGAGATLIVEIGNSRPRYDLAVDLAADGVKGRNTVTVVDGSKFVVGDLVVINERMDPNLTYWGDLARGNPEIYKVGWFTEADPRGRPIGQTLQVTGKSGNRLTFSTALHMNFRRAREAHVYPLRSDWDDGSGNKLKAPRYSGIEDLSVSGGKVHGNILIHHAAYCWVRNVESSLSSGNSMNLVGTFRCEVRDSFFHTTVNPNPGGAGYGIGIDWYGSDNLYENNIVWNFNKMTVCRASGGGNVFGYNYFDDGYGQTYRSIVEIGMGPNHAGTAHHELFEGNLGFNFATESGWGNSIYGTVFRNHMTTIRSSHPPLDLQDLDGRQAVGVQAGSWWYSFAGNVLGTAVELSSLKGASWYDIISNKSAFAAGPAMPLFSGKDQDGNRFSQCWFVYDQSSPRPSGPCPGLGPDVVPMWNIGYGKDSTAADRQKVRKLTYRHGNYDYVTKGVVWDPSNGDHNLPDSLYLSSKPAFFNGYAWPWVTPENPTRPVAVLPARERFAKVGPRRPTTCGPAQPRNSTKR